MAEKSRKQQIQEMLEADPGDSFLRYGLAMEYSKAGDDAAAADTFQKLLADSPDYIPAYFQCGQVLVRLGQLDGARDVLQKGIAAALKAGEQHTAEEMQGLLFSLG